MDISVEDIPAGITEFSQPWPKSVNRFTDFTLLVLLAAYSTLAD